ncbi:MAG TPA: phasin family protein [Stellaceae bacterium]|nr:phasin family protein [Stellaceae bacterium]
MPKASPKIAVSATVSPPYLSYAELADYGRETIAAAMNSNAVLTTGLEAIGQEVAGFARAAFESAGEAARALLGARTLDDVMRLQTDFARRNFDGLVERTAKLSELGCSLVGASVDSWGKPSAR